MRKPVLPRLYRYSPFLSTFSVVAFVAFSSASLPTNAPADEQLFGWVLGSETLPAGHGEAYEFMTLQSGKAEGTYRALDTETEFEYGFTDQFQASLALENNYFYNKGVNGPRDALNDTNVFRFGGVELSAKYRFLSPFKDPVGFALRLVGGYLPHDEVDGLEETEGYIAPQFILQKNYFDDTLVIDVNGGTEFAWGKRPAETYPRELAFTGGGGISYRFAPNWYIGLENHVRAEYPLFHLGHFEHVVDYAGPSIHYAAQRWWVTLSYNYQIFGNGIDEPASGQTFAEEVRHQIRLKIGFNF